MSWLRTTGITSSRTPTGLVSANINCDHRFVPLVRRNNRSPTTRPSHNVTVNNNQISRSVMNGVRRALDLGAVTLKADPPLVATGNRYFLLNPHNS